MFLCFTGQSMKLACKNSLGQWKICVEIRSQTFRGAASPNDDEETLPWLQIWNVLDDLIVTGHDNGDIVQVTNANVHLIIMQTNLVAIPII